MREARGIVGHLKRRLTDHDLWMRLRLDLLAEPVYGGIGSILALHRVRPASEASKLRFNGNLEITPEALDSLIVYLKRSGYRIIGMDEAVEATRRVLRGTKWIVFTLDDGYRDNLTHALPIFDKHRVPFTVFVTTCFPDRTAVQWWYVLEDMLLAHQQITIREGSNRREIPVTTDDERNNAFADLAPLIAFSELDPAAQIERILGEPAGDPHRHVRTNALSWDDVKTLANSELVTIGAHTTNHASLAQLDEVNARAEMADSVARLADACGKQIRHFAYPYGGRVSATEREFRMVRESGLTSAVTTREANIFGQHASHLESLPRIGVTMKMLEPTHWPIKLWLSGLVPCHQNHFNRVITA